MEIEGGCHCGALRCALSAAPEGSMICHCRSCRRISEMDVAGAGAVGGVDPEFVEADMLIAFTRGIAAERGEDSAVKGFRRRQVRNAQVYVIDQATSVEHGLFMGFSRQRRWAAVHMARR